MNSILRYLRKLGNEELLNVSEAIDLELERRLERVDVVPDSARSRANEREQSYRHRNGASAPPIRLAGLGRGRKGRLAA
jgi:hypothetical protein